MYGPRATQVSRLLGALTPLDGRSTVVCRDPRRGGPHWRDGVDAVPPEGVDALRVAPPEEQTFVRAARRLFLSLRHSPDPQSGWIEPAPSAALAHASSTRPAGLVSFAQPWSDHLVGLRVPCDAAAVDRAFQRPVGGQSALRTSTSIATLAAALRPTSFAKRQPSSLSRTKPPTW